MFTTRFGRPLDGDNLFRERSSWVLEPADSPWMRFHALRHAAAPLLMAEGVPLKMVSEMPGHSDVGTTLRIYSDVRPTMPGAAADAMDSSFGAKKQQT